jgi:DNA-binding response OmpR family regulator
MPTVLLVEDEAAVAELVAEALADVDLEVAVAATDTEAYALLDEAARRFDVLITDINLGVGTTGFDVARRARQLNRALKVVYITGQAVQAERFGVEDGVMFPKPFSAPELAARVKALLDAEAPPNGSK